MLKRNHQVKVYLNDKEHNHLKRAVAKSGLTQSTFLRFLIKGYAPQEKPPQEYYEILNTVRGACRNINQLSMIANATGIIDAYRFDECYQVLLSELLKTRETVELPRKVVAL
jgi:hypothetical protein